MAKKIIHRRYCHIKTCRSIGNLQKYGVIEIESCFVQRYVCRDCNTRKLKKYRATENGISAIKRAVAKYGLNNSIRRQAWSLATKLPKQKPCIECGKLPTHKHHPDISKPLDIIYLCPLHHKQIHMGRIILPTGD